MSPSEEFATLYPPYFYDFLPVPFFSGASEKEEEVEASDVSMDIEDEQAAL